MARDMLRSAQNEQKQSDGRTFRNRSHATPLRELIGAYDANEHGQCDNAQPPADGVSDHVHLLSLLARASPERDTSEEERPVDRARGVRVRVGKPSVVLQHGDLQLEELAEEVHLLDGFGRGFRTMAIRHVCNEGVSRRFSSRDHHPPKERTHWDL